MSFDLNAIGRPGDEHSYEVTADALQAYADATDDVIGGPVFALLPIWVAAGQVSRAVASEDVRPQVVHYEQDLVLRQALVAVAVLQASGLFFALHVGSRVQASTPLPAPATQP